MEFYAQNNTKRPVRLSEATRRFAYDSLNRKYGLDTLRTMGVSLDDVENINTLHQIEKQDLAILRIAEQAPIRICEGERISGAATLGLAIKHKRTEATAYLMQCKQDWIGEVQDPFAQFTLDF